MKCFNCGAVLSNSDFCNNCGANVAVYKKVVILSNTYYNQGLVRANNRDLSGAVDILSRSVRLNKNNVDARNLLGLVYFEMGETVQAFSEWVLSANIQPENNAALRYLKTIKANQTKLDNLNQSIKKYNTALKYAKDGETEMSILQLNKVLNINPNLIKAYQLLALMYMRKGLYVKARKSIMLALKIDTCNPLCIKYKKEIESNLDNQRKLDPAGYSRRKKLQENSKLPGASYISGDDVIIPQNNYKDLASGAIGILQVLTGIVIGALAVYFIVTPLKIKKETKDVNEVVLEYNQKLAIKNSTISELEARVDEMTKQVKEAEDKETTDKKVEKNNKYLLKAMQAFLANDYDKSMEALTKIDKKVAMNSDVFDSIYLSLHNTMAADMANEYYDKGMKAIDKNDKQGAIEYFKKCIEIDENYGEAYYKLGFIYSDLGQDDKAEEMFEYIVKHLKNFRAYNVAKAQVSEEFLNSLDESEIEANDTSGDSNSSKKSDKSEGLDDSDDNNDSDYSDDSDGGSDDSDDDSDSDDSDGDGVG